MSDVPSPVHPGAVAGGDGPLTPDRIDAILADFRAWLEAEASGGVEPRRSPAGDPADLLALAREFTALRHEVNLQTKAARAAVEKLSQPPPPPDPREAQRPLVQALVDVADALTAGHRAAETVADLPAPGPPPERRGLFSTPTGRRLRAWATVADAALASALARLGGVADGYALSLKRVDRALTAAGLEPIPTVGERFDPQTMEAVELADGDGQPSGTVLAESRRGYRWYGELFRFARVTVAR